MTDKKPTQQQRAELRKLEREEKIRKKQQADLLQTIAMLKKHAAATDKTIRSMKSKIHNLEHEINHLKHKVSKQ